MTPVNSHLYMHAPAHNQHVRKNANYTYTYIYTHTHTQRENIYLEMLKNIYRYS